MYHHFSSLRVFIKNGIRIELVFWLKLENMLENGPEGPKYIEVQIGYPKHRYVEYRYIRSIQKKSICIQLIMSWNSWHFAWRPLCQITIMPNDRYVKWPLWQIALGPIHKLRNAQALRTTQNKKNLRTLKNDSIRKGKCSTIWKEYFTNAYDDLDLYKIEIT